MKKKPIGFAEGFILTILAVFAYIEPVMTLGMVVAGIVILSLLVWYIKSPKKESDSLYN